MLIKDGVLLRVEEKDIIDGTFVIGSDITSIGECAFAFLSNLKRIEIPSNVENIEREAFFHCASLKSVVFKDGVKNIGISAFLDCKNLEKVKFSSAIEKIEDLAFFNTSLNELVLPSNLKSIGKEAFSNIENLERVYLNDSIEQVGSSVFKGNINLRKIDLGNSSNEFEHFSFEECLSLEEIIKDGKTYKIEDLVNSFVKETDMNTKLVNIVNKLEKNTRITNKVKFTPSFLLLLNNEQMNDVLDKESVKFFKDIYNKYIKDAGISARILNEFYKFSYKLGCFNNETVLIDGKNANVSQKASVFLKQVLDDNVFNIEESNYFYRNVDIGKYNLDLLKFITVLEKENNKVDYYNFKYLLNKRDLMNDIINNFDVMKKEVLYDNRGMISSNKSVRKRIDSYLLERPKYNNVRKGNETLAQELAKFSVTQDSFDEAQMIRTNSSKAKRHLLDEELKEEDVKTSIEKIRNGIKELSIETKEIIDELVEKEFTYEWLDKYDPKNFTIGFYCDCCATIVSEFYGKKIMEKTITRNDVQNLVIKDSEGTIIAKSTVYLNRNRQYAVFNNIEMNRSYGNEFDESEMSSDEKRVKIYKAFKRGVKDFIDKYNEQNKDKPILQVNMGLGHNRLIKTIKKIEKQCETELLDTLDGFQDAQNEQFVLYKK